MDRPSCAVAVMAKAPRAGRVKTRLTPPLTAEEAEVLSGCFLRDVTANIALAGSEAPIHGFVAYAPAGSEAAFQGLTAAGTGFVLADGIEAMPAEVEGFGRCLLQAARRLFARGFQAVCLLNADSPNLPTTALTRAAEILAAPGDRVVLGPAEDGGYYLIGIKSPHAELFARISWSTEQVAAQTRARAEELSLELVLLPQWYDVDDARALHRLLDQLATPPSESGNSTFRPSQATATARCLAEIGVGPRLGCPLAATVSPIVVEYPIA